ncbi:hypothetical protein [Staphylococcus simulans]|uniref:hypothetical protein n=1 Tax=Staphylococcus simulans TaxID=1286 RepID=UPI000D1F4700|nr:hypothetical protein [Staphylococcus simulans]PTJ38105.1 hypothetical protein BU024_05435 [Staphylococcus simulans]
MYDDKLIDAYEAAEKAYEKKFGEPPGRMFLRQMTLEESLERIEQCIKDNEPLEKFYLDYRYIT